MGVMIPENMRFFYIVGSHFFAISVPSISRVCVKRNGVTFERRQVVGLTEPMLTLNFNV